jgi:hypothetical protein
VPARPPACPSKRSAEFPKQNVDCPASVWIHL